MRCGECGSDAVVDRCPANCRTQGNPGATLTTWTPEAEAPLTMRTQRHTTSSRRPGVDTGGSHVIVIERMQACLKCQGLRYGSGPHARRAVMRAGVPVWVDCAGDQVAP